MDTATEQKTLGIIKPDAVSRQCIGEIITAIEQSSLSIIGMKMLHLSSQQAAEFYAVHKEKPFFEKLVSFMTSAKIVVIALAGTDAIKTWRTLMGATDPSKAADGTLRKRFGSDVTRNACHGSDAPETAETELNFFFRAEELTS